MKNKINKWLYKLAKKFLAKRLVHSENRLTNGYLLTRGWIPKIDTVRGKTFYCEPNMKGRDVIYIDFEAHYYRVWHSEAKTFIALESSIEWFELYYLLAHGDNGRYELAGM